MAKKETAIVKAATKGGGLQGAMDKMPTLIETFDFSKIKVDKSKSLAEQRRQVAIELGLRKPRKIYDSPQARKAAAKKRADEKRELKRLAYEKAGIPFGKRTKMTKEERTAHRTEKRHAKKDILDWGKSFMKEHPEEAKKYGIDPSKYKF